MKGLKGEEGKGESRWTIDTRQNVIEKKRARLNDREE